MVKVYLASSDGLDIDAALGAVSPHRREKVMRLHDDEKKRVSLAVELLLKYACGRTDYALTNDGKPYFEDGSVHFSLSHCGSIAVCAVADSPCGVDIERVPDAPPLSVAKRFFTEAECDILNSAADKSAAFCELWVEKEAVVKALGIGLRGLSNTDITQYNTLHFPYGEYRIGICLTSSDIGGFELNVQENISQII